MSAETGFTKDNLDLCLKALAKEYRKINGTAVPAELILIGGAAVLAGYGFRNMTYDIDAIIHASSAMDDAAVRVSDKFGLPSGWLNSDFTRTRSYSPKLVQYSRYYKTFSNVLAIRIVSGEYLIAMKLMSGRQYKNDLSDIIGILKEEQNAGTPVTFDKIDKAICELYGSWAQVHDISKTMMNEIKACNDFDALYKKITVEEKRTKSQLSDFDRSYPEVLNEDNIDSIILALKRKKGTSEP